MQFISYNTTKAQDYIINGRVARVENCNGFVAINTGDTPVRVNGQLLWPAIPDPISGQRISNGESINLGGNLGEIYIGFIEIEFVAPFGTDPRVTITQKYYTVGRTLTARDMINCEK